MMNNYYLLLALLCIITTMVYGEEKSYTYLSAKVMEEEIGLDWWDILNADATCCPGNTDESSCDAEAGSKCVWFPKPNNKIAKAAGSQCVGESFVKCKRRGGLNACCTPKCNPVGPKAPNPPGQTGPNQNPPVCGPVQTPSPVTPNPTTPTPTEYEACDTPPDPYNIQIILDESGSVGASNYDESVDFVKKLTTDLIDASSPMSIFSFSNAVDELHSFSQTQSRSAILNALENAKSIYGNYQGRCTDTMAALEESLSDYQDASDNGDLNTGDRYLFLVTDGVPFCGCSGQVNCDPNVCDNSNSRAMAMRNQITNLGIRLVVIGIGSFDITTIECLAVPADVFQVTGFTDTQFQILVNDVRPILCDEETTTPAPVTPAPVTPSPTTPAPTTPVPTTPAPTTPSPTTPAPTTPAPTTPSPTTPSPTTPSPTTPSPTTAEPTTAKPTTASPTTSNPTTSSPTTSSPTTARPTKAMCAIDINYDFEGFPCQISGDPHTKKVHDGKHDFQGQPTLTNLNGELLNQFFYVAPCDGSDDYDMPISVLGTHYHWGTRPVSGIDYFTIILTTDAGHKIYVYASSELRGYATDASATPNYDETNAAGYVTPLVSNVAQSLGGGKFEVTYKYIDSKSASFVVKVDNDDDKKIYIYMKGQMNRETDIWYNTGTTRYRMHYVYMTQSSKYKCHACGLCGDYSGDANKYELVLCDGTVETVRAGWNGDHTPEAYDIFGLTYEYNFYNDNCVYNYDITDNDKALVYEDPCDANIAQDVINKCQEIRDANAQCCNDVIGGTVCDDLQEDCEFDACVIATDNGGTAQDIADAVDDVMGDTIQGACAIDGIGDAMNPGNVLLGDYLGCYKDSSTRRFEWPTSGVRKIADHNTAECVRLCVENNYKYMGLQYDTECFCGNDLATIQNLGLRDPAEGQCGMNQQGTDQYDAYGCWGGAWTNCVYDISKNYPAAKKKYLMVESNKLLNNGGYLEYLNNNNNMMEMGIIGGILLIGIAGLIYKKYSNKDGKYIAIDDQSNNYKVLKNYRSV